MVSFEDLIAHHAPIADVRRSGSDLAGVFYTGGTTGFPKGVMLSHGGMFSNALAGLAEGMVTEDCVMLHIAPMFHLADIFLINMGLVRGARHVILPTFEPLLALQTIQAETISEIGLVPLMLQLVVDHPRASEYALSSVRQVLYGAAPISETVLDRALKAMPAARFYQAFGQAEVSPVATILPPYFHTQQGRQRGKIRSGGRATFGVEVRIVDERDVELPRGQIGEIIVRGPNVMLGYWNKPAETLLALRGGWMHTGDGGRMDEDGFVFIVDRIKDMIVSGGENVYSAEVENALSHHPSIAACAVIGVPDKKWGERVHAVIVLRSGTTADADELIGHCKALIANYKCPRTMEFRETLPVSAAGKVLKAQLRAPFWEGHDRGIA
jgi:long-chain acyl-CoA synthetase